MPELSEDSINNFRILFEEEFQQQISFEEAKKIAKDFLSVGVMITSVSNYNNE